MICHEVPFKDAKKDCNGYATLLVKFGDWYVPVKGKPLPLTKEEAQEYLATNEQLSIWKSGFITDAICMRTLS